MQELASLLRDGEVVPLRGLHSSDHPPLHARRYPTGTADLALAAVAPLFALQSPLQRSLRKSSIQALKHSFNYAARLPHNPSSGQAGFAMIELPNGVKTSH
jgi:hypothetical protein